MIMALVMVLFSYAHCLCERCQVQINHDFKADYKKLYLEKCQEKVNSLFSRHADEEVNRNISYINEAEFWNQTWDEISIWLEDFYNSYNISPINQNIIQAFAEVPVDDLEEVINRRRETASRRVAFYEEIIPDRGHQQESLVQSQSKRSQGYINETKKQYSEPTQKKGTRKSPKDVPQSWEEEKPTEWHRVVRMEELENRNQRMETASQTEAFCEEVIADRGHQQERSLQNQSKRSQGHVNEAKKQDREPAQKRGTCKFPEDVPQSKEEEKPVAGHMEVPFDDLEEKINRRRETASRRVAYYEEIIPDRGHQQKRSVQSQSKRSQGYINEAKKQYRELAQKKGTCESPKDVPQSWEEEKPTEWHREVSVQELESRNQRMKTAFQTEAFSEAETDQGNDSCSDTEDDGDELPLVPKKS
ncbi:neurofilament medium polypeptide-like [Protopterus annectens]|uniref:neurofilament medium polypeptide-like n=1 Tax=Protopterus annectens TaxID=7888 RepID=UPI001CFAF739|nr:neurofilament medium polypeptide-like [Protopterus annectens]